MEFKKQTNNIESTIKTVKHFVNQGPSGSFKLQGMIPKRQFGGALEKILKANHPYINRKQYKTLVLQGVGLKAPVKKL